jgi:hypothetical protein
MGKSRGAQITTLGINMADEGGFGIQASALMNNAGSDDGPPPVLPRHQRKLVTHPPTKGTNN